MKTLIIYDSYFGNTKEIAIAISEALNDSVLINIKDFSKNDLEISDLIIVGSPTRGFNYTESIKNLLDGLSTDELKNKKVLAFDTRIDSKDVKPKVLGFLMKTFGYASEKILKSLTRKGAIAFGEPGGFIVTGKEGPLRSNEKERAQSWVKNNIRSIL